MPEFRDPQMTGLKDESLSTRAVPNCLLCGTPGGRLYEGFTDRGFDAPGVWSQRKCPQPECGLVWLDPVPTEEDIGKVYRTYYTHNQPTPLKGLLNSTYWTVWKAYLRHRFNYKHGTGPKWISALWPLALLHPGGRAELDAAAMYLPAPIGSARLLDVGCGAGVALKRMQDMGWEVRGQEIDPKAARSAQDRGVSVDIGTLTEQNYPGEHFDAVHVSHVIEHVHDPLALLRECYRVLKTGAKLVVTTPNIEGYGHRRFGAAWSYLDPPRHLVLFSEKTLGAAAKREGFRTERLSTTPRTAWVAGATSGQIERTGKMDFQSFCEPRWLSYGLLYQIRQRLALFNDPHLGDELLLVATKGDRT